MIPIQKHKRTYTLTETKQNNWKFLLNCQVTLVIFDIFLAYHFFLCCGADRNHYCIMQQNLFFTKAINLAMCITFTSSCKADILQFLQIEFVPHNVYFIFSLQILMNVKLRQTTATSMQTVPTQQGASTVLVAMDIQATELIVKV